MKNILECAIKVGYVVISDQVMRDNKAIRYFYREEKLDSKDSGWRFLSGEETQDYVDCEANFNLYNVSTLLDKFPELINFLEYEPPIAFEFDRDSFIEIEDKK